MQTVYIRRSTSTPRQQVTQVRVDEKLLGVGAHAVVFAAAPTVDCSKHSSPSQPCVHRLAGPGQTGGGSPQVNGSNSSLAPSGPFTMDAKGVIRTTRSLASILV